MSVLPAIKEPGQRCQAWIELIGLVEMHAVCQRSPAHRAQPRAVWPAEWMHRLGEAELIVEERTKVDLVVVIDALGRVAILDRDREPIVRVHGGQELLVDGDPYVLDIGLEASGARAPQRCRDGLSGARPGGAACVTGGRDDVLGIVTGAYAGFFGTWVMNAGRRAGLFQALHDRGPLEPAQVRTIVDALDRVAGEIERS